MVALERLQLLQQGVELGVGDLGVVVDVVALFVVADLLAESAMRAAGVWLSKRARGSASARLTIT